MLQLWIGMAGGCPREDGALDKAEVGEGVCLKEDPCRKQGLQMQRR